MPIFDLPALKTYSSKIREICSICMRTLCRRNTVPNTHQTQYYQGFSLTKMKFIGLNTGLATYGGRRFSNTPHRHYFHANQGSPGSPECRFGRHQNPLYFGLACMSKSVRNACIVCPPYPHVYQANRLAPLPILFHSWDGLNAAAYSLLLKDVCNSNCTKSRR